MNTPAAKPREAPWLLRSATALDSRAVFEWRNDPLSRRASGDQSELMWETHERWFEAALGDADRVLLIGECPPGDAFGMCRFDLERDGSSAIVSINLAANRRGRGLGRLLLNAAIGHLEARRGATHLVAKVRQDNAASLHIFGRCGFVETGLDGELRVLERQASTYCAQQTGRGLVKCALLVDCGPGVGLGHLRRCLALAGALRRRSVECRILVTHASGLNVVTSGGFAGACDPSAQPDRAGADIVILDGYRFSAGLAAVWKKATDALTVVIDDLGDQPRDCDVVLNHNIYGGDIDYGAYGARAVLGGAQYALLDPAFAAARRHTRPPGHRVVVSFGGSDDGRYGVPAALEVLNAMPAAVVDLLLPNQSVAFAEGNAAKAALLDSFPDRVRVHENADLARLMADATHYFGAAGVTLLEAFAAGLDVVVCAIADNQLLNIRALQALRVPAFERYDPAAMAAVIASASRGAAVSPPVLVDGHGADRVAAALLGQLTSAVGAQA